MNNLSVHFSSESVEHYTPDYILMAVERVLGAIDLDPCADPGRHVRAAQHFTREDDGLSREWRGRVFVNWPYGKEHNPVWAAKLIGEYDAGRCTEAIALVPGRPGSVWWQSLERFALCFHSGRITFIGNTSGAPFPSAYFYLGPNVSRFVEVFSELGSCWARVGVRDVGAS